MDPAKPSLELLRTARTCPGAVLDSTWRGYALPLAGTLTGRLIEVHRTVPLNLARTRYRARTGRRHAGHLAGARSDHELRANHPARSGPVPLSRSKPPAR